MIVRYAVGVTVAVFIVVLIFVLNQVVPMIRDSILQVLP